jgi:hypothetical protein
VVLSGLALGVVSILPIYTALPLIADQLALVFLLQLILVTAVALVTGPQTALLSELFSARTRYTAVGLPHNLSAGWIGGLSPYMVNLIASQSGIALVGLMYPNALLLMALLVCYFKLPETCGRDLAE